MEEKKQRGGFREGSGRKFKADEAKANSIFLNMVKDLKNVDTDEEAKLEIAKELFTFERGKMFIAEHVFGKPKETIENINIDAGKLTEEEIKKINDGLNESY